MKICIDARSPGYAGIRNYASCLLRGMSTLDRGLDLVVLRQTRDRPWDIPGIEERTVPSGHLPSWLLWSNTKLPRMLETEGFDLYHSLKHITAFRGGTPKIVTFHSARFLFHPEHYKWYDLAYWKMVYPRAARTYDAVVAVSEAEKRNYVERMGAPAERMHVIQLASDDRFQVVDDVHRLEAVRAQFKLPQRFVLYVGRQVPVKNLETVLRGYRAARAAGVSDHDLVFVGRETFLTPSLRALADELGIAKHVHLVGPVYEELPEVYNLADLFVLMSHYEAFPAVPLESMACGTPVITSDRGGLPEVVGDAGVSVGALDVGGLGNAIAGVLGAPERLRQLRENGLERVRLFSWENCASRTVDLYETLLRQ